MVEVQIPAGSDQPVRITVRNRGEYGPQQWYTLLVSELTGDPWGDGRPDAQAHRRRRGADAHLFP
jgi:hypothetical protein